MAQLAEQLICNQQVNGSSPFISSIFLSKINGRMPEWLKGADCKSVDDVYDGSNPSSPTISMIPISFQKLVGSRAERDNSENTYAF